MIKQDLSTLPLASHLEMSLGLSAPQKDRQSGIKKCEVTFNWTQSTNDCYINGPSTSVSYFLAEKDWELMSQGRKKGHSIASILTREIERPAW